jgi:hypothetical protein
VEQHYRVSELAGLLGVTVSFVCDLCAQGVATKGREGLFPSYMLSKKVTLVPASAVLSYLRSRSL